MVHGTFHKTAVTIKFDSVGCGVCGDKAAAPDEKFRDTYGRRSGRLRLLQSQVTFMANLNPVLKAVFMHLCRQIASF